MKKISIFIIAVLFVTLVHAQDSSAFKFSFNHLALSVKDVNRAADFYKNVLHLQEITNRTKMDGIRGFRLARVKSCT